MSKILSPSPILESFVRYIREELPQTEAIKVDKFADAISHTTSKVDTERARRCFHWALEMADDKSKTHPRWREIQELHEEWKVTWFGLEFGLMGDQGATRNPGEDVHIQWVEHAVSVAKTIGEQDGWQKSPWEALLRELIEIGGNAAR